MRMTKAEARTIRDELGLTPPMLADLAGLPTNAILFAEGPRYSHVPEPKHETTLRELADTFRRAVERRAEVARASGVIVRRLSREAFETDVPELTGWPVRSMGIFYANLLSSSGVAIQYEGEVAQ